MTTALVTLDPEDMSKRVADVRARLESLRQRFKLVEQLEALFRSNHPDARDGDCEQRWFLHYALELVRLEHAIGTSPRSLREILREAVAVYSPVVPLLNYSPRRREFVVHSSHVTKFQGGKRPPDLDVILSEPIRHPISEYQFVHINVKNQPALDAMKEAIVCALMAWDFTAAKTMAESYQLEPRIGGDKPNRFGLFREAVLGHTDGGLPFLGRTLEYSTDRPPERHELAEGVIRNDASMVRKGLKTVSSRFKTVWTLKTYCTPAKRRRYGSVENILPDIRKHLLSGTKWLLADWAIAWMSLAWHRDIKEAFDEPKLFSHWVPWEACCPEPPPPYPAATK